MLPKDDVTRQTYGMVALLWILGFIILVFAAGRDFAVSGSTLLTVSPAFLVFENYGRMTPGNYRVSREAWVQTFILAMAGVLTMGIYSINFNIPWMAIWTAVQFIIAIGLATKLSRSDKLA